MNHQCQIHRPLALLLALLLAFQMGVAVLADEDRAEFPTETVSVMQDDVTENETQQEEAEPGSNSFPDNNALDSTEDSVGSGDDSASADEDGADETEASQEAGNSSEDQQEDADKVSRQATNGVPVRLSSDTRTIRPGGSLKISAALREQVESNAVILHYAFDGDLFEVVGYTAADGAGIVDTRNEADAVRITLMIPDYAAKDLGTIELRTRVDAELGEQATVSLAVEYVLREGDEEKTILWSKGSISFDTLTGGKPEVEGDTNGDGMVDIIDLSNIIDWFGTTDADPAWEILYVWFDFNENGEIDIYDIAYVARLIGTGGDLEDSRSKLERLIVHAQSLQPDNYTEESWDALQQALTSALTVAENSEATDTELAEALEALQTALDSLEWATANLEFLQMLIDAYDGKLDERDYSADSWADFVDAMNRGKWILANPDGVTPGEVNEVIEAINDAFIALERIAINTDELAYYIDVAEKITGNPDRYTRASVRELEQVLVEASRVLGDPDSQAAVDDMAGRLLEAINSLIEAGNTGILQLYVDLIRRSFDSERYTEESWNNLLNALELAQTVIDSEDPSAAEVDHAIETLAEAVRNLVTEAVNRAALEATISHAQEILANADRYIPSTLEGLQQVLDDAIAVYRDENATQDAVDEAVIALAEANAKVRVKADLSKLQAALDEARSVDLSKYTAQSAAALLTAVETAESFGFDETSDQEEIDAQTAAVQAAYDELVPLSGSGGGTSTGGSSSSRGRGNGGSNLRSGGGSPLAVIRDSDIPLAAATTVRWIEQTSTNHSSDTGLVGIRKTALETVDGRYTHDTMAGNAVQVRVTLTAPAQAQGDLLLSGFVDSDGVRGVKKLFETHYSNRVAVVVLEQPGSFDQTVQVATRLDLAGMEAENLCFYR